MKPFFTAEDFDAKDLPYGQDLADLANAKLEREGKRVWGADKGSGHYRFYTDPEGGCQPDDDVTGLVINVELIDQNFGAGKTRAIKVNKKRIEK
jgi:hypothetical protein